MKIAVAQFYTNHVDYAQYSVEVNKLYCDKHGYEYINETDTRKILDTLAGRSPTWYKPKFISEILNNTDVDYVLFLDIDAVIVDHEDKIENYISPEHDLVFTDDYGAHSKMNAGVFIVKNTDWVKQTMSTWWELGDTLLGNVNKQLDVPVEWHTKPGYFRNGLWHDQSCLTYMYETDEEFRNKTKIITHRRLNWREPFDNSFVFHAFAYGHIPFRKLNYVCNKITNRPMPTNEGKTLLELANINPTDKQVLHNYFGRVYTKLFEPLQQTTKRIMEIGVLEGYSLMIWRDYFTNAEVIGVDNNPTTGQLVKEVDRITLTTADTGNPKDLQTLREQYVDLDIILDDGGHRMHEQQLALAFLFHSLKDDGIYIIENLQTSVEAKMPEKQMFNWGDPEKTTTLDMLRHFQNTGKIISDYLTPEQCAYLENRIGTITIFDERGDMAGITSVITKKPEQSLMDRVWTTITTLFRS